MRWRKNWNGIKDDWDDWENSAGVEGTDKGYKTVSGQCYGDTHLDIWLRSMDSLGHTYKGQIEAMQMSVLRRIEGVSRLNRVRIVDFRGRLKQEGGRPRKSWSCNFD